jgi:hypothetical protein
MQSPAVIVEPLKARIITKPSVCLHLGLQSIQKALWSFLRYHPSGFFSLIGEPLGPEHLVRVINQWQPGMKFNNADFKASTDNVSQMATEIFFDCFFHPEGTDGLLGWNPRMYLRGKKSLIDCKIDYTKSILPEYEFPFSKGELSTLAVAEMTNGQLMGNIISFPILCAINYGAYHIAREIECGHPLKLWDVPYALFNGDDHLSCVTNEFFETWKSITTMFGLEPSVGKNLLTDKFIQINSEVHVVKSVCSVGDVLGNPVCETYKIPYINFGLITCRRKQDCSTDLSRISSKTMRTGLDSFREEGGEVPSWLSRIRNLSSIQRSLVDGLDEVLKGRAMSLFLKHTAGIFSTLGLRKFAFDRPACSSWYREQLLRSVVKIDRVEHIELFPDFEEYSVFSEDQVALDWKKCRSASRGDLPYFFPKEEEREWRRSDRPEYVASNDLWGFE